MRVDLLKPTRRPFPVKGLEPDEPDEEEEELETPWMDPMPDASLLQAAFVKEE